VSDLDLRREDWLPVETAVKMMRLQEGLGAAPPGLRDASRM